MVRAGTFYTPRCNLAQLQLSKSSDPLASLRIDRSEHRRPRTGWFGKFFFFFCLVLLVAAGYFVWANYGSALLRTQVRVATVEAKIPGVADAVLSAQGYIKSRHQAAIGAKLAGRILEMRVEEGQQVERGAILAVLEHADIDASLEAMEASLDAMRHALNRAEQELAEAETTLTQDERDFARAEHLYRNKGLSLSEFERSESKLKTSRSRRNSLEAAVTLAFARIREAEARMRETDEQKKNMFVSAPFSGTVISKEAELGESIMPGGMGAASGRGSVVTLADLDNLEVETDVKEDFVGRTRKGQKATIAVDAVPGERFSGEVRTIIPMGDRARGTIKVKVTILDKDPRLFPEMAASVHFLSEGKDVQSGAVEPQIYVPASAVKDEDGAFVWKVVNDRVKKITVDKGEMQDGRVLIQRGLNAGEQVVINPPASLEEDMPVRIVP